MNFAVFSSVLDFEVGSTQSPLEFTILSDRIDFYGFSDCIKVKSPNDWEIFKNLPKLFCIQFLFDDLPSFPPIKTKLTSATTRPKIIENPVPFCSKFNSLNSLRIIFSIFIFCFRLKTRREPKLVSQETFFSTLKNRESMYQFRIWLIFGF